MADNLQAEQISTDEQIAKAQEMLSIATRNYYVKAYSDAADDFSSVCSILSEVYGPSADELGKPYLMYAKCLIALGQDENKLMDIPEEEEDDQDEQEDDEDESEDAPAVVENAEDGKEKTPDGGEEKVAPPSASSSAEQPVDLAQPGSSTGITRSAVDGTETTTADDEDDVANLQVAWEVLELAVGIFSRQPDRRKELAESYIELAGISFENSNFEAAIKDFKQALVVLQELEEKDNREFAEISYKIGLAYTMLNMFDDARISLLKACGYLDEVIAAEERKEPRTEEVEGAIVDLKETKAEIENKITEVDDYKQQSMEEVKRELAKLVGPESFGEPAPASGEGASSSSKPAADISHLIKRKRPDEGPPSKSAATDITHLVKRKKD